MAETKTREDVIEKIKKLLRQTEGDGTTIEETAAFAARAQALMTAHHVDGAALGDIWEWGTREGETVDSLQAEDGLYSAKQLPFWICRLANCLADLNQCEAFLQVIPNHGRRKGLKIICVAGATINLSAVKYLFDYLHREIVHLARIYCVAYCQKFALQRAPTNWRNDFKLGATDAVVSRMRSAREEIFEHVNPKALARIDSMKRAAELWIQEQVTKSGPPVGNRREASPFGYLTGRRAGAKIQLHASNALEEEGPT